jgi:hypothetical protein
MTGKSGEVTFASPVIKGFQRIGFARTARLPDTTNQDYISLEAD